MLKTLFSRRYILVTLLVIAAMLVMARLGVWQLERREQRIARNADLAAKLEATPLSLNEAAAAAQWPLSSDRSEIRNTRASAQGRFDYDNEIVLLQQTYESQLGAHVVTPLLLEGAGKAILVDRGWIPAADVESGAWSQYVEGVGALTVDGFLQPSQILFGQAAEKAAEQAPSDEPRDQWFRVDVEALQRQMPYELLPVYLMQSPGPAGAVAPPYKLEPEVDLSEGPHMGYALQWFAFALIAGIIYVAAVRSRERKGQVKAEVEADAEAAEVQAVQGVRHA